MLSKDLRISSQLDCLSLQATGGEAIGLQFGGFLFNFPEMSGIRLPTTGDGAALSLELQFYSKQFRQSSVNREERPQSSIRPRNAIMFRVDILNYPQPAFPIFKSNKEKPSLLAFC